MQRRRKRRLLLIHTRLARFFTWILLLGFIILSSTLTRGENSGGNRDNQNSSSGSGTGGSESDFVDSAKTTSRMSDCTFVRSFPFVSGRSSSRNTHTFIYPCPLMVILTFYHHNRFAIGYVCCLVNGFAISWLWYIRKDDYGWLFTNLFSAGLISAFSGLIMTLVNVYGVQKGKIGSSTTSTLVLSSFCTFVYAVLTVVYSPQGLRARIRRGSRASSATMV